MHIQQCWSCVSTPVSASRCNAFGSGTAHPVSEHRAAGGGVGCKLPGDGRYPLPSMRPEGVQGFLPFARERTGVGL